MKIEIEIINIDLAIEAFYSTYRVEKDVEGNDLFNPKQHLEYHIQNYIRNVVSEYVKIKYQELAASKTENNSLFKDELRRKVLDERAKQKPE